MISFDSCPRLSCLVAKFRKHHFCPYLGPYTVVGRRTQCFIIHVVLLSTFLKKIYFSLLLILDGEAILCLFGRSSPAIDLDSQQFTSWFLGFYVEGMPS